jgi:uncharacterized protein YndB with AHSA1/START domain
VACELPIKKVQCDNKYDMKEVYKELYLPVERVRAFDLFVTQLNKWWPREYTWSQEKLAEIKVEPERDGLCIEIGPYGFRCDWGRITEFEPGNKIALKWQISAQRIPIPDPQKASDIAVVFKGTSDAHTLMEFRHFNFIAHGEGHEEYLKAMDAPEGWDYILNRYAEFARANAQAE